MQTKKQSLIESITNTVVGFIISYASTFLIFPLVGIESSASKNIVITLFFTVVSIFRGFLIRRYFNKKHTSKEKERGITITNTTNAPDVCECGLKHPLVAEFGKCGKCWGKIYGGNGDPTYN